MKIFDRKDVYSWSNAEDAKQYIGGEGYFSDELKKNLKFWVKGTLKVINTDLKVSEVFAKENEEGDYPYGLFIPANKVKEVEEKKWRAFKDIGEFQCVTNVNSDKTTHTFSITCTNSQIESYLEALNFVIGLATMICPKDELHLVSLAEELENILNKGLLK